MEFYLDRYMHPKHGKPIVLQGPRKKKKKPRIVQPSTVETEPEPEVPMKREMSKDELMQMQSKMLISQLSHVSLQQEDTVNIDESLRSDNHLKILLGLTAFRTFFQRQIKEETTNFNPKHLSNRIAGLNQMVKNKGEMFKIAMLRPQPVEAAAQYHVLGFEVLLETI